MNNNIEINELPSNPNIEAEEVEHIDTDNLEMSVAGLSIYIDPEEVHTTRLPVMMGEKQILLDDIRKEIAEAEKFTINGFRDKKGLEQAKAKKSFFLKGRTGLNKYAKENVIDKVNKVLEAYKSDVSEVSAEYKKGQDIIQAKIDAAEKEWELEQERIEKEKQARINDRITRLQAIGATFNPNEGIYTFDYDAGLIINPTQLNEFSDEEFSLWMEDANQSYLVEQQRLEQERIANEKEQERLREAGEQLKVANARIAKYRIRDLEDAGAIVNLDEGYFIFSESKLTIELISTFDNEEWDELLGKLKHGRQYRAFDDGSITVTDNATGSTTHITTPEKESLFTIVHAPHLIEEDEPEQQNEVPSGNPVETGDETPYVGDYKFIFTGDKCYYQHRFTKSILRLYPIELENEIFKNIPESDIQDRGVFGDTTLRFVLFKLRK